MSGVSLSKLSPDDQVLCEGGGRGWRFELLPFFALFSLMSHVVFGFFLVSQWALTPLASSEQPAVFVEIVTGVPPRPLMVPPNDEAVLDILQDSPIIPSPEISMIGPQEPEMVVATHMMSGRVLADPRNKAVREGLLRMTDATRADQLCGIEAMEQLKNWDDRLNPEWVSAYATSAVEILGNVVVAEGAAFRSAGQWYHLKFECTLDSGGRDVISFAFSVGAPIPEEELDALELSLLD